MRLSREKMYLGNMHLASTGLRGIALKSIAGLVLGLGIWGCTSDNMAGGGPSGTEAGNAITATLYNEDGSLAKYATVMLIKRTSLSGEANAYTVQADSNGLVVIDSVDVGDYIMEVSLEGNNAQIDVTVANDKDSVQLGEQKLQKPVYISGSLVDYGCKDCASAFGTLKFFGLNHSTIVTNGMFSIGGLPAGNLNFAFIPNMGAKLDTIVLPSIKAKAGDSIVVEHVAPTPTPEPEDTTKEDTLPKPESKLETLLLEDFTDGDDVHNMGAPYTRERGAAIGSWSLITGDYAMGNGAITVEPKASSSNPFTDIIETDDDDNKLVHFKVTFPDSDYKAYPPPFYNETVLQTTMDSLSRAKDSINWVSKWWTTCIMQIGKGGVGYNISLVDSIAFEAWGTGSFTFEFLSGGSSMFPMYTYNNPINSIIEAKDFDLPKKKSRIAVAVADLIPDEEKRMNVSTIAWTFRDDVEFFLDNLELIGHDLESIWTKE